MNLIDHTLSCSLPQILSNSNMNNNVTILIFNVPDSLNKCHISTIDKQF